MSKITTTVAAMTFLAAALVLAPAGSAGTASARARAVHITRSAR